jgi:hypothetical protein
MACAEVHCHVMLRHAKAMAHSLLLTPVSTFDVQCGHKPGPTPAQQQQQQQQQLIHSCLCPRSSVPSLLAASHKNHPLLPFTNTPRNLVTQYGRE